MVAEASGFWNIKCLSEMTDQEWESLCDGCGRCCLHKLEDIDSALMFYTNVSCRLLDSDSCKCRDYDRRLQLVPDCLRITPQDLGQLDWLPRSCAYRRLAEGRPLAWWHPLVSGSPDTVHQAGISVAGRTVAETTINPADLQDHIITWIDF